MPLLFHQPHSPQPIQRRVLKRDNNDNNKIVAPIYDNDNIPFNYIIVIDAGSKGSRAHLYSYKSTLTHLQKNASNINLDEVSIPHLISEKHWHKKIKPSIESSILKYGLHNSYIDDYLDHLIYKIYKIVPIEQHSRTPIFFHATAGLRAIDPILQSKILDRICYYLQTKTDFYLPDCSSHINILDGDIEGLYSWITLNYLFTNKSALSNNNQTLGLLQLGGGSAQVCFQPSKDQIEKHSIQLLNLNLDKQYSLYSTSFLGYGLNQFHHDYLLYLIDKLKSSNESSSSSLQSTSTQKQYSIPTYSFFSNYNNNDVKLIDPCLPQNFTNKVTFNDVSYTLQGSSDFNQCILNIYTIIGDNDEQCKSLLENFDSDNSIKSSSCMLNSLMPQFDFQKDRFVAISGYWDTVTQLMEFTNQLDKLNKIDSNSIIYNPQIFIQTTEKICNSNFKSLLDYNNNNNNNLKLSNEEISNLCFKSTYISALLHSGYGLSQNLINDKDNVGLLLNDQINNTKFSWTLGRALLYAADESLREYNEFFKNGNEDTKISDSQNVGFYRNSAPSLFYHGSEQLDIPTRPKFQLLDEYPTFTFNVDDQITKSTKTFQSTETTREFYYDFDNGYNEDDDSNFDNYNNYNGNDDDYNLNNHAMNSNDDDETEFVYANSRKHHIRNIFLTIFVLFLILFLIPFTRSLLFKLYRKVRIYFSSYRKLNQNNNTNNNNNPVNGNLRKFHITNNNNNNNKNSSTISSTDHTTFSDDSLTRNNINREIELDYLNQSSRDWQVSDNLRNDVISDIDFDISDNDWDNDSDGIERAV